MISIAHALKVVRPTPGSEWEAIQRVTFESIRRAHAHAPQDVSIDLCVMAGPGETVTTPEGFRALTPLERFVTRVAPFRIQRPLPLLRDVLDRLYRETDADYLLYTNADIALMPEFYAAVASYIRAGHDAVVINRRTIPKHLCSTERLAEAYSAQGTSHPGYDCFLFRRDLYERFVLGDVCLGVGHVDLPLICSMIAMSENFLLVTDRKLTFHFGDDRVWTRFGYREYRVHNDREAAAAVLAIADTSPRPMRWWQRLLLRIPLLKNALVVREFRRMYARPKAG